ncbi:MAG: metallopeptidase family protein [Chloroflexi bacterium]|nr:metallopeptidase family protein [Chloroflexota bacterium]MBM3183527.1 metallopeptidase family protein [Chloroflexota bacterium]MBM4451859.1 metallopeptidase family protein [Chloroflexota bacterium]MBM4454262.1 metallopeptidase family protein [Chloroflexota bacterium]
MSNNMDRQRFEELVIRAIEQLPPEFQDKLENVDVLIEDWPSRAQLGRMRLRDRGQLLGLYEGIPHTERGNSYNLVLPDKITIFQKPIEALCHTESEIEAEIVSVVRHEIAHHFGTDEKTLRKLEGQKRRRTKRPK